MGNSGFAANLEAIFSHVTGVSHRNLAKVTWSIPVGGLGQELHKQHEIQYCRRFKNSWYGIASVAYTALVEYSTNSLKMKANSSIFYHWVIRHTNDICQPACLAVYNNLIHCAQRSFQYFNLIILSISPTIYSHFRSDHSSLFSSTTNVFQSIPSTPSYDCCSHLSSTSTSHLNPLSALCLRYIKLFTLTLHL